MKNEWLERSDKRTEAVTDAVLNRWRQLMRAELETYLSGIEVRKMVEDEIQHVETAALVSETDKLIEDLEKNMKAFREELGLV